MSTERINVFQNGIPAVDVKQNASPARHEEATVPKTPVRGRERRIPMGVVRCKVEY